MPEIEALLAGKSVLGLPDGVAFDIVVETDATPDPPKTSDPD
jgi:hypothetical protein